MAQQLAVEADQLAALYYLGTPLAVYKPSTILAMIGGDENNGAIAIRKQGKWLNWSNLSLSETPNVLVFEALVNSIVGSRP